tara:strand:- start:130 stop:1050 length:921 start_codon:yes stop_codon:yes gene_type:complete
VYRLYFKIILGNVLTSTFWLTAFKRLAKFFRMTNVYLKFKLLLKCNRLIFLYTLLSISVANADGKKYRAIHSYYFGGFNVLGSVTDFYANKSYYKINTESSTKGALNLVFDWKGIVKSEGIIKKSRLVPRNFKSLGRWGKEIWITDLTYNKDGQIFSTKVSPLPDAAEIIPLPLNPGIGAIDPLSFILQFVINATVRASCKEEVVIFDGRRRYKLKIKEIGVKNFPKTRYNIFTGKALACELKYIPLGGQRRRTFEPENQNNLNIIYLARPSPAAPIIPVSFSLDTSFGTLIGHLVTFESLGRSLK